jgi:hypothetical protein
MRASARTHDAAALASSVILRNLLDRLGKKHVLNWGEISDVLSVSANELEPNRMIGTTADAIDFIQAMLGEFRKKDLHEY